MFALRLLSCTGVQPFPVCMGVQMWNASEGLPFARGPTVPLSSDICPSWYDEDAVVPRPYTHVQHERLARDGVDERRAFVQNLAGMPADMVRFSLLPHIARAMQWDYDADANSFAVHVTHMDTPYMEWALQEFHNSYDMLRDLDGIVGEPWRFRVVADCYSTAGVRDTSLYIVSVRDLAWVSYIASGWIFEEVHLILPEPDLENSDVGVFEAYLAFCVDVAGRITIMTHVDGLAVYNARILD